MITLIITIILAAAGTFSVVAEGARPGDALYPIKVKVNEEVRAAFTGGAEANANWDMRRAERRLEEAEEIAAEADFNAEARTQVASNFKAFADRVEARVNELKASGDAEAAAEVSSRFETSLQAHERVLSRLAAEASGEEKAEIEGMRNEVREERLHAAGGSAGTENRSATGTAASAEGRENADTRSEGRVNLEINVGP